MISSAFCASVFGYKARVIGIDSQVKISGQSRVLMSLDRRLWRLARLSACARDYMQTQEQRLYQFLYDQAQCHLDQPIDTTFGVKLVAHLV